MEIDDPLVRWAQQGARTWRRGGAVVIACPNLSRRDRLVVHGAAADVTALVREALPEVGPTYRPLGDEPLIDALISEISGLELAGRFAWMETCDQTGATDRAVWLDETDEVERLLRAAFPDSYAWPGGAGVRRWAGIHQGGTLVATAADAWSVPEVGFVAGVATHPEFRGRGLATEICSFVTDELLRRTGRVALITDYGNAAAIATYTRLGFALRPLAAAKVAG